MEAAMTYGHLILIVIGLVALIALWRIVDPPSEFRREFPRPGSRYAAGERGYPSTGSGDRSTTDATNEGLDTTGLDTPQSARLLDHQASVFARECRLADESRVVAERAVGDDPKKAQAYLEALREEYKNHAWHSDQAHALRAVIVELSAAIEKRRQI
jgi:hypothetical protein